MIPALLLAAQLLDSLPAVRVNQVGYLPDGPKVAVVCAAEPTGWSTFRVRSREGRVVMSGTATDGGAFGPCAHTLRLNFSRVQQAGSYVVEIGTLKSTPVRIGRDVWAGGVDTLLMYMRQQRSGWNPYFRDSVHRFDGFAIDDTGHVVKRVNVSGGWADASDYLQYVATSATATYDLLAASLRYRQSLPDLHVANGLPGHNSVDDALDEARHGLDWLLRMYPVGEEMYNQLGDDRDHAYLDLPTTDTSDYGWGKGRERPVYPCTGRPQGLFAGKNRASGFASTAGKYAAAFALAARMHQRTDPSVARTLRDRAIAAYSLGRKYPGACQTAPGRSPYFYEEDDWADDMELGAAELYALTKEPSYLRDAIAYAREYPVSGWMGADTARHYQFYPFHNRGHYVLWTSGDAAARQTAIQSYRRGLDAVVRRAGNGFRIGIPFIWCSNDLMISFATQAMLYRRMTGDTRYREYEQAAIDWLFGTNPWGTSMVVGYPRGGRWPHDPHSVVAMQFGPEAITGGLLDGPVYRSIYGSLRGIALRNPDEYAPFNTGHIVYHDDLGDYSTNEPIMDGTAALIYLVAAMGGR